MMIVRRELPEDRAAICSVHTAAFGKRGGQDVAEGRLVDDLRNDGDVIPGLSLIATVAGEVVGHVVCSRGRVVGRSLPGLGPLGVRLGFVLAESVGLLPPEPSWVPYFQVRPLPAWDDSLRGTFRYAPAFERL